LSGAEFEFANSIKEAEPAALETRNDEETSSDGNEVLDQGNVEILLPQGSYEPSAGVIGAETTNDSAEQS
jgi:hypothetical protein